MNRLFSAMAVGSLLLLTAGAPPLHEWPNRGFLIADGDITAAGLHGRWHSVTGLGAPQYAVRTDLGLYRMGDIDDGHTHWRVEPSGGSHVLDSAFAVRATATEAWLAAFGWLDRDFRGATRSASAFRNDGGRPYRIVTATPRGGTPVTLWFDAHDGALAKAVRPTFFSTRTSTYGDYRAVNGWSLPFVITNVDQDNAETIAITSYRTAGGAPDSAFAPPGQPDDASLPNAGTIVPIVVFPQLTLEASVNGRKMAFLFDTGGHSIVTPDAAKALGLKVEGNSQTGGSGAGTILQQDTRVEDLRIGEAVLRDQHFYVLSLPYSAMERGAEPPIAGLLGLEIAERFIVRIDYRAGKLSLLPREAPVQCASGWRSIRFTDDMPTIDAELDGRRAPFTIDTGNNGSLMLYRHWLDQQGVSKRYDRGVETLSYGAGGASRNWISYGKSFRVDSVPVRRPMVRTTDDKGGISLSVSEAGNLGTYLLANYAITLDYGRSRACFQFVPGYVPLPFNRAGIRTTKPAPAYFEVALVNPGGPAAQAGLLKGDRIVAIDGQPALGLSSGDMALALARSPGSRVQFRYQRNGEERDAVITTREMLRQER